MNTTGICIIVSVILIILLLMLVVLSNKENFIILPNKQAFDYLNEEGNHSNMLNNKDLEVLSYHRNSRYKDNFANSYNSNFKNDKSKFTPVLKEDKLLMNLYNKTGYDDGEELLSMMKNCSKKDPYIKVDNQLLNKTVYPSEIPVELTTTIGKINFEDSVLKDDLLVQNMYGYNTISAKEKLNIPITKESMKMHFSDIAGNNITDKRRNYKQTMTSSKKKVEFSI